MFFLSPDLLRLRSVSIWNFSLNSYDTIDPAKASQTNGNIGSTASDHDPARSEEDVQAEINNGKCKGSPVVSQRKRMSPWRVNEATHVQESVFPNDPGRFVPEGEKVGRKGYQHTRWRIERLILPDDQHGETVAEVEDGGKQRPEQPEQGGSQPRYFDFDLVNLHLFHDRDNLVCYNSNQQATPYVQSRLKALSYVLKQCGIVRPALVGGKAGAVGAAVEASAAGAGSQEAPASFIFGDFNFRLALRPALELYCKNLRSPCRLLKVVDGVKIDAASDKDSDLDHTSSTTTTSSSISSSGNNRTKLSSSPLEIVIGEKKLDLPSPTPFLAGHAQFRQFDHELKIMTTVPISSEVRTRAGGAASLTQSAESECSTSSGRSSQISSEGQRGSDNGSVQTKPSEVGGVGDITLMEFPVQFAPSYGYSEKDRSSKGKQQQEQALGAFEATAITPLGKEKQKKAEVFAGKRLPAWTDRVLLTPSAHGMVLQDSGRDQIQYGTLGADYDMGDHKPVFLTFLLG